MKSGSTVSSFFGQSVNLLNISHCGPGTKNKLLQELTSVSLNNYYNYEFFVRA